jgi:hypothetical protein
MHIPESPIAAAVWIVCLVVLAIVLVFLFNGIILPILKQVT